MAFEQETSAARAVLDAHIAALNAHDPVGLAATLHFPHFRLSGTTLKTWQTSESYFDDFRERAGGDWAKSSFDDIRVVQAAKDKVHFDDAVNRYDSRGAVLTSFRSLWVITREGRVWAAKFRSSFAPI